MFQAIPSFFGYLKYLYQERFEGTKGVIQRCNNDHVIKSIFTEIASFSIFGKNHKNYNFTEKLNIFYTELIF